MKQQDNIPGVSEMLASTVDQHNIADGFTQEFKEELLEYNELVKGCQTLDNITRTDELAVKFHQNTKLRLHKPTTLFSTGVSIIKKASEMSDFASKQADALKDCHFFNINYIILILLY